MTKQRLPGQLVIYISHIILILNTIIIYLNNIFILRIKL